ncbi:MAG: prepilin-type N-terminal cleavage/methylation domain-containing protein [Sulfuritalea sp.]|nr:prepilin-type N-terminal cleavage/methylation domain-containing protein [Sulfuritalea sp.]
MRAHQAGFTLVEIAIVLVIIGLLLVGVLQGQEMIENTKTKSIVSDMRSIQAAYNGYIDRYKTPPGDENLATMQARGWNTVTSNNGSGNGVLLMPVANTFTNAAGESVSFWQALRASGFLSGSAAAVGAAALPRHSANGMLGVASGTVYGLSGVFVCASGLGTKQAAAVDTIIDGPLPASNIGNNVGNLRANTGGANPLAPAAALPGGAAGTAYNETTVLNPWTVCMRIG